tara:strand:- start:517 stop:699 length:183 start_codon:yes stop_codon:yes gene_type:complete
MFTKEERKKREEAKEEKRKQLIFEAYNLLENFASIEWISDTDYEYIDRALCKALDVKEIY